MPCDVPAPGTVTWFKGSPKWEQTSDGHVITATLNVYVFNPMEARLYLPQYGDRYVDPDGFTDKARVVSVECLPVLETPADPLCKATVKWRYSKSDPGGATGEQDGWAIETTPSTEHITHVTGPDNQMSYTVDTQQGVPTNAAIGHNGDPTNPPNGLDVQAPYSTVRVWKYFDALDVTAIYLKQLEQLRPRVNLAAFQVGPRLYERGELLYVSFDVSETQSSKVRVEFTFLARANETNVPFTVYKTAQERPSPPVPGDILVDAEGWQYVEQVEGLVRNLSLVPANDRVLKMLTEVRVSTVYRYESFTSLRAEVPWEPELAEGA